MTEQQQDQGVTVYLADGRTPEINFPKAHSFVIANDGHLVVQLSTKAAVAAFRPGLWTHAVVEQHRK